MPDPDDLVFLVPGFLGFDHFGGFPYFSQGVAAALRVAVDAALANTSRKTNFHVLPLSTIPAGSLAERQQSLSDEIVATLRDFHDPNPLPRIHLIGHSTGGLDAELFVRERSIRPQAPWSGVEAGIRRAVRSVIPLAAPAAGTGIAESAVVRGLAVKPSLRLLDPRQWLPHVGAALEGLDESLALIHAVLALGATNAELGQFVAGGLDELHPLLQFIKSLLTDRELLGDLRPEVTKEIVMAAGDLGSGGPPPSIRRYVTVARNVPGPTASGQLFAELHRLCAVGLSGNDEAKQAAAAFQARIDGKRFPIIGATKVPDNLSEEASDGVVNTCLQIPPGGAAAIEAGLDQIAAVIVADHLDVVGGFPADGTDAQGVAANGFLTSGSLFRPPEFSALYRAIAADVVAAMATPRPDPV